MNVGGREMDDLPHQDMVLRLTAGTMNNLRPIPQSYLPAECCLKERPLTSSSRVTRVRERDVAKFARLIFALPSGRIRTRPFNAFSFLQSS